MAGGVTALIPPTVAKTAGRLRPMHIAGLGCLMALGIVFGRLLVPADGDISRFVVAGDNFVDARTVDPPIHVIKDSWGYDGTFYWRLAVDPGQWELGRYHHGVIFDSAYRPPRILYPVLAWALSGGHAPWAATTLVLVNVLAYGAVAGFGAMIAERAGRPALSGLLLAAVPGLVFALARDLPDIVTLACMLGGIVALQRKRWGWGTLAWTLAVLSREEALVAIAGYAAWRLATLLRHQARRRLSAADLPWLVPPAVWMAWQGIIWARIGELPILAASDSNITLPFGALGPTLFDWARGDIGAWDTMVPFQFALAVVVIALAFGRGRELLEDDDRWLLVSLGLVVLMAVSLGVKVWDGPADLRQVLDVFALSWVILLSCRRPLPSAVVVATALVWVGTGLVRAYAI